MALLLVAEINLNDDVITCHQNKAKDLSLTFRDRSNHRANSWFSHDVTKIRTTKLLISLRFYFNDV